VLEVIDELIHQLLIPMGKPVSVRRLLGFTSVDEIITTPKYSSACMHQLGISSLALF
jgi:hypothetical protein